jgi:acyl dehydratase
MSVRVFASVEDFAAAVGTRLGSANGPQITQEMITRFGELTGSDDWIHSDPARAAESQFGGTIAQGDLVLAMIPRLMDSIYKIEGVTLGLIYGSNCVRYTSVIPVGSRPTFTASLLGAAPKANGTQVTIEVVVHLADHDKPALVAEVVYWLSDQ